MPRTYEESTAVVIEAPAEHVWDINGRRFADVGQWSRNVHRSEALSGEAVAGAPFAGRVCEVKGFGTVREALTHYDDARRSLVVAIEAGLPFFVKESVFRSRVIAMGENRCRFEVTQTMVVGGVLGAILMPMLRRKLAVTVAEILDDLRLYAETGEVHPDKAKRLRARPAAA